MIWPIKMLNNTYYFVITALTHVSLEILIKHVSPSPPTTSPF